VASQVVNLKAAGLYTYYQTLMEVPPGALLKANNVVINRAGVIEPRRGIAAYGSSFGLAADRVKQLLEYKGTIIRHIAQTLSYDNGSGVFTNFSGNYTEAKVGNRMRSAEALSNFYFATSNGVKKISARTSADFTLPDIIEDSGGPKATSATLSIDATAGFLPNSEYVSYRILWIYTDRNSNLIFGTPSFPSTIQNTAGAPDKSVSLTFQIPYDVTSSDYKYRIYRSENSTSVPSDELYQVYEGTPTPAELFTGTITHIDSVSNTDRLGGVPLYSNEISGEGALQVNEPPPAAKDIVLFKGHMFYANTRTRHSLQIKLNDNTGLVGQSIDIGSNTYVFSVGSDLEETSRNLVDSINANSSEVVSAYYISPIDQPQGKIYLERKTLENTSFTVTSTVGSKFTPNLTSPGATSSCEAIGHRLYYSKYQEVEAVPLLNYIDIGSKDQEISRIVSLRDSLFIFKGDGLFRLAGDPGLTPSWSVTVFDNTSIIQAPDTAVTLANQCYYFSNQGIMRLNESGLDPISRPIEDKLLPFLTTSPYLPTAAFAVAYESDRSFLLWTVLTKNDTYATVCYRYNIVTDSWTEWKIPKTCAVLNRVQNKLYFGSGSDNYVEVERKNFDRFDYADRQLNTILANFALNSDVLKISNYYDVSVEDVILQEQYVTIYQFNSLLKKLDLDSGLQVHGFYEELKMSSGDNLTIKISQLVLKLNAADPTVNYSALWTTPSNFATIQSEFNDIVTALNNSVTPIFINYQLSVGTVKFEAVVNSLDNIKLEITLNIQPAFVTGPMIIYKGIKTEVEYAPQHAGDPASHKQFSVGTLMFERRSFYTAQVGYKSDISDNYEEISFIPNSAGIFGGSTWGDGTIWGGQGDQAQIRTYIPLKKQRCRFLGCKFTHGVALESFQLYGLALSVRQYMIPDRDYK